MKNLASLSLALTGSVLLQLAACAPKDEKPTAEIDPFAVVSEKLTFKVDTLFTEFESPWGMTWLPDGRMLVVERKGEILVFKNDKFTGEKLTGVPEVHEVNQAGLLDIALHPDFANNGWLYLAYARPQGEGDVLVISRAKLDGNNLNSVEEIFVCGPEWKGGRHFGSRIIFDKEGYLYFSNGDKGSRPENA